MVLDCVVSADEFIEFIDSVCSAAVAVVAIIAKIDNNLFIYKLPKFPLKLEFYLKSIKI